MSAASSVRLGIVGCAGARPVYGPILRLIPGLEVTALMDTDEAAIRSWARELPRPVRYTDYDRFLAEAPLDAVLLASPLSERAAQVIAAAQAGKPIFCVAPLARSLGECDAILQATVQSNVLLMTALLHRFEETFLDASRLISEGRLGALKQARYDGSFAGRGDQPTWRRLFEARAHDSIDLCRWWLGEVQTVSAHIDSAKSARGVDDRADLILNHERGVSIHHISRGALQKAAERYQLNGATGTLDILARHDRSDFGLRSRHARSDPFQMTLLHPGRAPEEVPRPHLPDIGEKWSAYHGSKRALEHFADCLRTGREPRVTGLDGRKVMEVLAAAYLSSQEETKIALPLTRDPDRKGRWEE